MTGAIVSGSFIWIHFADENGVDPNQLASNEASWSNYQTYEWQS